MIPLPLYSPCVGCGRCCDAIGMPPFETPNPDLGPQGAGKFRPSIDHPLTDVALEDMVIFLAGFIFNFLKARNYIPRRRIIRAALI